MFSLRRPACLPSIRNTLLKGHEILNNYVRRIENISFSIFHCSIDLVCHLNQGHNAVEKFILNFSLSCHFSTKETLFFFLSLPPLLPSSLPPFHIFFVFTCVWDYTGHCLPNSILSKIRVSWPVSLCPEMTSSLRVQSGKNHEVGGWSGSSSHLWSEIKQTNYEQEVSSCLQ